HLVPPLLARFGLGAFHLGPGLLEGIGAVPGLPGGTVLPGADHDALVERLRRDAELDADPSRLRFRGLGPLAKGSVPLWLLTGFDRDVGDDGHHGALQAGSCRNAIRNTSARWSARRSVDWAICSRQLKPSATIRVPCGAVRTAGRSTLSP